MTIYAVHYGYEPAKAATRDAHRAVHRQWLSEEHQAGNVLLSGPYPDGSGALILIRVDGDIDAAEAFMANDPFNAHQAVDSVRIVEFTQVYGPFDD
ncbi:YciI family protein [Gordonia sp. L191]|uniref:YciI family protein n=1 Tax=Gordonia TaxID=2053 RepID=UPI0024C038AF|nr:YciI family protein [Gordonia sp. L191]WHU49749.1 YciI family protein [Gordonia sp. L191]